MVSSRKSKNMTQISQTSSQMTSCRVWWRIRSTMLRWMRSQRGRRTSKDNSISMRRYLFSLTMKWSLVTWVSLTLAVVFLSRQIWFKWPPAFSGAWFTSWSKHGFSTRWTSCTASMSSCRRIHAPTRWWKAYSSTHLVTPLASASSKSPSTKWRPSWQSLLESLSLYNKTTLCCSSRLCSDSKLRISKTKCLQTTRLASPGLASSIKRLTERKTKW